MNLVFNLKRIAHETGSKLGDFIQDIETIFDKYHKITEDPVKLFNFIIEISECLNVITDHIEMEELINTIDNFYNREIEMEESESFLAESETKAEIILENAKKEYQDYNKKIDNAQQYLNQLTSQNNIWLAKLLQDPNKEKLQESLNKITKLQNYILIINEKAQMLESENQEFKKMLEQNNKEKLLLEKAFERIGKIFPQEMRSIVSEIENERQ